MIQSPESLRVDFRWWPRPGKGQPICTAPPMSALPEPAASSAHEACQSWRLLRVQCETGNVSHRFLYLKSVPSSWFCFRGDGVFSLFIFLFVMISVHGWFVCARVCSCMCVMHVRVYVCRGTDMSWCVCVSQRTTFRSQFSPLTVGSRD